MQAVEPSGRGASILLITIDTLRADRIGAYGYNKARTPNLDALARRGLLFRNAFTHSYFTGPSLLTILSGMTPPEHGLIENGHRAPEKMSTLADWLRAEGWDTAGFVTGFPVSDQALRIGSRFARFDDELRLFDWIPLTLTRRAALPYVIDSQVNRFLGQTPGEPVYRPAELVTDAASEWLGTRGEGPFFLWVHYFDPHLPYRPPRRFWNDRMRNFSGPEADGRWFTVDQDEKDRILAESDARVHLSDLYDAEVAYVDEQLGRLLKTAHSAPSGDNLLIVVTADHGTGFGEHHGGWGVRDLYDTTLHVPLIVVPPKSEQSEPQVIEEQFGLADVAPKILELAAATVPAELTRNKLRDVSPDSVIAVHPPENGNYEISYAIRDSDRKLIHRPLLGGGRQAVQELYDLKSDPVELENLIATRPREASQLFGRLRPHMTLVAIERPELTPTQIEALRSLGYIQ